MSTTPDIPTSLPLGSTEPLTSETSWSIPPCDGSEQKSQVGPDFSPPEGCLYTPISYPAPSGPQPGTTSAQPMAPISSSFVADGDAPAGMPTAPWIQHDAHAAATPQPAGPPDPASFPPGAFIPPPGFQQAISYSVDRYNPPLADGVYVAPYWRRVVARLIDTGILLVAIVVLNASMGDHFATVVTTVRGYATMSTYVMTPLGASISLLVAFVLEVVVVRALGGQLGKLAMGLRIADARNLAIPTGLLSAVGRWLVLGFASAMCLVPGLLFCLSPLWNQPYRRGWHDRMTSTIVVGVRKA